MSVPTFIGFLLLAFSAGLVLHPAVASTICWISDKKRDRKISKAAKLLTDAGWTVLHPDQTTPVQLRVRDGWGERPKGPSPDPLAGWGEVETGIGFTTRGNTGVWE